MMRGIISGLLLATFVPAVAQAQTLEIDHKAVGCIVVGKHPKMNACFAPAANLARARVYFRPEGIPTWYYVDMKTDQPCFAGTLPKPGKKLVGKKIEYYVEGQDKTFNPGRTAEYGPVVVNSAQECKKDVPVAPFVNNATVAVFPGLPAGFVGGGIGTAAVVGIAAAGAAAAGTAAVVASNDDTTTTTVAVGVNTTTTLAAVTTTTTTTTTTPPRANRAPFAVLTTSPDPPSGQSPVTVTFDLCKSTDPDGDSLSFFFDFGDGGKASGSCLETHTYSAPFRQASSVRRLDRSYNAEACVVDPGNQSACRTRTVNVTSPAPQCPDLTLDFDEPDDFAEDEIPVEATGNGNRVTFCAEVASDSSSCESSFARKKHAAAPLVRKAAPPATCVDGSRSGDTFSASIPVNSGCDCYAVTAEAGNVCGATAKEGPFYVSACGGSPDLRSAGDRQTRTANWSSDLSVDGGRLQVTINGTAAFPGRGRRTGASRLVEGENRVEAVLVESAGKPGLWRLEFKPSDAIVAGSLRVISGETVLLGPTSGTFRFSGAQGERIVFTFLKK